MTRILLGLTLLALAGACDSRAEDGPSTAAARADSISAELLPRFTTGDSLVRPEGWESWVLAGTSIGLTYTESATPPGAGEPPGDFLNVYLQPWAYAKFMETGEFPQGTMFVLIGSDPVRRVDPARGGFTQGPQSLLEVHLKWEDLHESGWGFYGFGGGEPTAELIPGDAACYTCHRDEAAFDHAFVQFYPAMRERLGMADAESDSAGGAS